MIDYVKPKALIKKWLRKSYSFAVQSTNDLLARLVSHGHQALLPAAQPACCLQHMSLVNVTPKPHADVPEQLSIRAALSLAY